MFLRIIREKKPSQSWLLLENSTKKTKEAKVNNLPTKTAKIVTFALMTNASKQHLQGAILYL